MKKIILLSLVILSSSLKAQTGLQIGILGGVQNSWIINRQDRNAALDTFKYRFTGGYGGMFKLGYNFGPPFGIHTGVIYSVQGQKHTFADSNATEYMVAAQLTYIKIPLLIHISSDPDAPAMFVVEFGPQFGLVNKAKHSLDGVEQIYPVETKEFYTASEIEFTWAIGADLRLGDNLVLNVHHRGDYGIPDMENKTATLYNVPVYPSTREKANNFNMGIWVGLTATINPSGGHGPKQLFFR